MESNRKYEFSWDFIGNITEGRPNLGPMTRLELYRLMQFCFRDAIERKYGTESSDKITYDAGYIAGQALYDQIVTEALSFQDFIVKLQGILQEMGIGIMKVETADYDSGQLVITISEDLDCSGLPDLETTVCYYDVGFISAVIEKNTGRKALVEETDCWASGSKQCRFHIQIQEPDEE